MRTGQRREQRVIHALVDHAEVTEPRPGYGREIGGDDSLRRSSTAEVRDIDTAAEAVAIRV